MMILKLEHNLIENEMEEKEETYLVNALYSTKELAGNIHIFYGTHKLHIALALFLVAYDFLPPT